MPLSGNLRPTAGQMRSRSIAVRLVETEVRKEAPRHLARSQHALQFV